MSTPRTQQYLDAAGAVLNEIKRARAKHPNDFHSAHEGYAVLHEELDELWDEVKADGGGKDLAAYKEAKQVAAMAIRYMVEIAGHEPPAQDASIAS